jgi:GDP-L-fucose synthase
MKSNNLIYVAGHNGMVGSAIVRNLKQQGYTNLIMKSSSDLDLRDKQATEDFFAQHKPKYVFLAAAKVGGIIANDNYGADFISQNLAIQSNVIESSHQFGVKKLLFLGSSCIYPKLASQPMKEEALLTGELEPTNLPYAIAKIAGKIMCDAYYKQYDFDAFTVMPPNVYGVGDNFHPENSHVIAGLMYRFHQAKINKQDKITCWGTGSPFREFIYADDLGDACVFLMKNYSKGGMINAGSGEEISIKQLAKTIAQIVGFEGELIWDTSKPDGTPKKLMDNSKINQLGWKSTTPLKEGLEAMYQWYLKSLQQ